MNKPYQDDDSGDLLRHGYRSRRNATTVSARDKMQPSLLDRLTDNAPDKRQEPANSNLVSHSALRRRCCAICSGCSTPLTTKRSRI